MRQRYGRTEAAETRQVGEIALGRRNEAGRLRHAVILAPVSRALTGKRRFVETRAAGGRAGHEAQSHPDHARRSAAARSDELREMVFARAEGKPYDRNALSARLKSEVAEVVRKQVGCGIDSVNDGEVGKTNFTNYVRERLAGLRDARLPAGRGSRAAQHHRARLEGLSPVLLGRQGLAHRRRPAGRQLAVCVAPLRYVGRAGARGGPAEFQGGARRASRPPRPSCPRTRPARSSTGCRNEHYPSEEAFVEAIAEAMREEYRADRRRGVPAADRRPGPARRLADVSRHERARLPQVRDAAGGRDQPCAARHPAREGAAARLLGQLPRPAPQRHPARRTSSTSSSGCAPRATRSRPRIPATSTNGGCSRM